MKSIGHIIKERRQAIGMSGRGLSKLTGISPATMGRIEAGELQRLDLAKLSRIAHALGLTTSQLFAQTQLHQISIRLSIDKIERVVESILARLQNASGSLHEQCALVASLLLKHRFSRSAVLVSVEHQNRQCVRVIDYVHQSLEAESLDWSDVLVEPKSFWLHINDNPRVILWDAEPNDPSVRAVHEQTAISKILPNEGRTLLFMPGFGLNQAVWVIFATGIDTPHSEHFKTKIQNIQPILDLLAHRIEAVGGAIT